MTDCGKVCPLKQPRWAVVLRQTVLVAGEWAMDVLYAFQLDKAASWAYTGSRVASYWIDDKTKK